MYKMNICQMVIRAWRKESNQRDRITVVGGAGAISCGMFAKFSLISRHWGRGSKKARQGAKTVSRRKH